MNKFIFFLLLPLIGISQPVITNNIVPSLNTQYKVQYIENPTFSPGPSGANQVWDFSNLDGQFEINFNILDPSDAPESDQFTDAAFVWNIAEFESFTYYKSDIDSISQMGTVVGNADETTFMVINTDLEDALHFPLTYESTYGYHTEYENYLFGNVIFSGARDGTLTADAYGTITTPYGTYENTLRVKIETSEFGTNSTQYAWYDENTFIPILVYEFSDDQEETPSLYYADIDQTISSVIEKKNTQLTIYSPNAYQIKIKSDVAMDEIDNIRLYTFNGVLIQEFNANELKFDGLQIDLELSRSIISGIHLIELVEGNSSRSALFKSK